MDGAHKGIVTCLLESRRRMGGWLDEIFRAWNVASGETIIGSTKAGDDNGVWTVCHSPDGIKTVTGGGSPKSGMPTQANCSRQ